jgi:hypothetical protein
VLRKRLRGLMKVKKHVRKIVPARTESQKHLRKIIRLT